MADVRQKICTALYEEVADIFMLSIDDIAAHPEWNFRTDLSATSLQYFPLVTGLEEKLGITIDAHDFQWSAHTVGDAVDFLMGMHGER